MGANVDISQIVENEFRIGTLERILDKLIEKNKFKIDGLSQDEVEKIRKDVAQNLNNKYPGAGLEYKSN